MGQKNNDCIVIIPTHKETMTSEEERSFRNTLDILRNWDIALVLPEGVSSNYYEAIRFKEELQFQIVTVRSEWMGSLERYNNMGASPVFYKMFEAYKYILICHLDVWVFRDELQIWIDKGYDYIGAPWFLLRDFSSWVLSGDSSVPLERLMYPQGGNGGFSLRKVDKMIELTSKPRRSFNILLFCRTVLYYIKNKKIDLLKIYIKDCREVIHEADVFRKKYNIYEDRMFSMFYSLIDKNFRVAPAHDELYFCTEVYSEEILKTKLKWQLPFAIHGYEKYLPSITSIDEYRNDENRNNYTKNIKSADTQKQQKNSSPLITVITPTHNLIQAGRTETFRQCIESVHQQTYNNIEHIIIDGASSDGTLELIQEYVDKGWCACFSEPDNGLWDALYKGHQRANGQFVNIMNTDDYFCRTDAIEIAVHSLVKKNAVWFFSGGMLIFEDGSTMPFPTSLYGVFSCMGILHQTMLVRTDILRAMNPFHSNHITRENYLMVLLIINRFRYAYSKKTLVHYRVGGFSTNEYGGDNLPRTKNDFGKYFHNIVGQFWGMTEDECRSMYGWQCFGLNGVAYSYRLSKKLRVRGLRFAFRKKLARYIYDNRNIGKLLLRELGSICKLRRNEGVYMPYPNILKSIALHTPIIGDIVRERDRLRSNLASMMENQTRTIIQHANLHPYVYVAGFDSSLPENAPVPIIGRIHRAFSNELNLCEDSPPDVWSHITPGHQEIISLLNADHQKAAEYLNRMFTTSLSHGFQQGEVVHKSLCDHQSSRDWIAQYSMDKLCGLAEAIGCVAVENPEQGSWGALMSREPDELLALISKQLGFNLIAPNFQAGAYGLQTSRGLFTEREFFSILIANTVSRLILDKNTPICEIGGGGGLAFYLWQFGFRNITVIDIPSVNIAQAYWLHRNLPDCEITLSGEQNPFDKSPGIRVLSTRYFEQAPTLHFGLVVNVDSFPEISAEVVKSYLQQMRKNARLFLSINQEAAQRIELEELTQLIVHKQIEQVGGFQRKYRYPFWLRKGYVEEAYEIEPYENTT